MNYIARLLYLKKPINVIYHTNRLKKKNHIILSVDAEKANHKIQYPFVIKTLRKQRIEGNFLILTKSTKNLLANIIINDKRLNTFPLKSGTRQRCPLLPLLFDMALGILTGGVKQEERKDIQIGKQIFTYMELSNINKK